MAEVDPRPPGDRTPNDDVLAEIRALAERFERFVSRPPVVELRQSWWDQLAAPCPVMPGMPATTLKDVLAPYAQFAWALQVINSSTQVYLYVLQLADGIELSIRWDNVTIWQRKLFYDGGPR